MFLKSAFLTLILLILFCPDNCYLFKTSAAYIHMHAHAYFITEANTMNPDQGPYCLQYRPEKYISRRKSRQQLLYIAGKELRVLSGCLQYLW